MVALALWSPLAPKHFVWSTSYEASLINVIDEENGVVAEAMAQRGTGPIDEYFGRELAKRLEN